MILRRVCVSTLFLTLCTVAAKCFNSPRNQVALTGASTTPIRRTSSSTSSQSITPLLVYVEPVHFDPDGYIAFVSDLLVRFSVGDERGGVTVLFWPVRPSEVPHVWSSEAISNHLSEFYAEMLKRPGSDDGDGFTRGLRQCAELAAEQRGQIVLVLRSAPDDFSAEQRAAIIEIAREQVVNILAFEQPAEGFKPLIGGYVISASLGRLGANAGTEKVGTGKGETGIR